MLKIRLARTGRKKLANYRVVVSDSRRTPKGGFTAQLGHYNPYTKELVIDAEKTQAYLDNGTQPSSRMVRLLKDRKDVKLPRWALANLVEKKSKPKTEPAEPAAAAVETKEAPEVPAPDAEAGQESETEDKKDTETEPEDNQPETKTEA